MRRTFRWILRLFLVLLLAGAAFFAHVWWFKPAKIEWYYGRVFLQYALDNPELLTSLRLLDPFGIEGHNAKFSDSSPEAEDRQFAKLRADYETFKRYPREDYSGQELISYDVWDHFFAIQIEGGPFRLHNFPVNQMFGVQSSLPNFMANQHVVEDESDARNYLARLALFPNKFSQVIDGLRRREAAGILPPRFTVEKVLRQMREFIATAPAEHMLATTFAEKLAKIDAAAMDAATREALQAEVVARIGDAVYPAYRELIAYFESIAPKATSDDGAWRLPDGEAYYAWAVRSNTTTDLTAAQIHALGLEEVARIGAEMDAILREAGYVEGSIGERVQALAKSPAQLFEDSDAGREQILAEYQRIIDEIEQGLDAWFAVKPRAGVEVKRVPAFSEKTAPGAYYQAPSLDGKRPGTFFANLRNVAEVPRFGMRTLAYHEAVPGHHFQIAIAQELEGLPIFRRMIPFTAYSEGWALYAEQVAWEAGFQKNPLDNLGRLQAEMFRAVRLVVDTGLHAERWSRERAIAYMREMTGMGEDEVTAEIERYIVNPGQALAYKVGMLKILELRERARRELGDRFDIRVFHDRVLKNGAMPLFLLERIINQYIAETRAA